MRRGRYSIHILLFAAMCVGSWQSYRILSVPSLDEWVEVPATVDEAKVTVTHGQGGRRGRRGPTEHAVIKYSYRYDGQHYYGKDIWFYSLLKSKSSELKWVDTLIEARSGPGTLPCYVNPKRPSQAILTREQNPFALLGWLSLALAGPGTLVLFFAARRLVTRSSSRQPSIQPSDVDAPPIIRGKSHTAFD